MTRLAENAIRSLFDRPSFTNRSDLERTCEGPRDFQISPITLTQHYRLQLRPPWTLHQGRVPWNPEEWMTQIWTKPFQELWDERLSGVDPAKNGAAHVDP